jgi:hypothetical protein
MILTSVNGFCGIPLRTTSSTALGPESLHFISVLEMQALATNKINPTPIQKNDYNDNDQQLYMSYIY